MTGATLVRPAVDYGDLRLPERFWIKVFPEPNTGCWLWGGYCDRAGYGRFRRDGESGYAHRIVVAELVQSIPHGMWIDHLCRVRACCQPDHLDVVTPYENRIRGEQGHLGALRDRCGAGHPRTPENTVRNARGYEVCRTCRNDEARERAQRIRALELAGRDARPGSGQRAGATS